MINPSPYILSPHFTLQRQRLQTYARKTSFRTLAMLLNNPRRFEIRSAFVYERFCQIIAIYDSTNPRTHRRHRFSLMINRADVVDPLIWNTEDPQEFVTELLADLASRRELLKGRHVKREHHYVVVDKRYSMKPPDSINHHSIAIFTCRQLPGVQFRLDKTLDGLPPFYTLHTMTHQIIPVNDQFHWSGRVPGKCISWHRAFTIARIYAMSYWYRTYKSK